MIEFIKEYPIEVIGQKQLDNIKEQNRIISTIKKLVKVLSDNGKDAEDIAYLCWLCGTNYMSDYYFKQEKDESVQEVLTRLFNELKRYEHIKDLRCSLSKDEGT